MPQRKPEEVFADDERWLQEQPLMKPWVKGQERLEQVFDLVLKRNREALFEKPVDRSHLQRPVYSLRLRHCLRYHWEHKQNDQPDCSSSEVIAEIDQKYEGPNNVFDAVVLAVAVVFIEWKAREVFRPHYEKTFQSVASKNLTMRFQAKEVNHDDCREKIYDELVDAVHDSGRVKNARLNNYAGKGSFFRWLHMAIDRRIASYFDRQARDGKAITPDVVDPSKNPSPEHKAELQDEVRHATNLLTPEERKLLYDYHVYGMTLVEICEENKKRGKKPTDKGNLSRKLSEIHEKIKRHLTQDH